MKIAEDTQSDTMDGARAKAAAALHLQASTNAVVACSVYASTLIVTAENSAKPPQKQNDAEKREGSC